MNDVNIFDLNQNQITNEFVAILTRVYSINQDMNNLLLNLNDNFSDYQIQSNDGFKFNIHKLILLTRFDNNESILQKFIDICSQKSKEEVQFALNFIYSGFYDLQRIYQKFIQKQQQEQEQEQKIEELFNEIGLDSNWIKSKKGRKGIIKDLSKLYQQNETKDFTIIAEEKEIKVHKLMLFIRSELFKGMFLNVQDSSNQVHDYSEKSFETIQQLIYFLYHDDFDEKEKEKGFSEEFSDLKDYYQLNQNSIIDLLLEKWGFWQEESGKEISKPFFMIKNYSKRDFPLIIFFS
ncbi:speckle-type poz protein [Anaeramoeba ignava]|uniref:Speckle-type poz protein n=1 Tax=Anaeramoeba ignava TaxID=1746090 RepID=A0A9Q0LGS1_ANAIG|nr:speckle-type poz protein [Anaeramoeba ignava]